MAVHVIGKAFGDKWNEGFSFYDAEVAHDLLFNRSDKTVVLRISYRCKIIDIDGVSREMQDIVGFIILSWDMRIIRLNADGSKNTTPRRTSKGELEPNVLTLVQFGIRDEYKGLNLGGIVFNYVSVERIEEIAQSITPHFSFFFYC